MSKFKPAIGLKNKHLQTIYSSFFRKKVLLDYDIETFELEDSDFVECYWYKKPEINSTKPIVILFHGLEGSYKSPYITGIMKKLYKNGFSSALMHFRGCSGRSNRLPRLYHSGDTSDAKQWIEYLSNKYKKSKLYAVGYSLGGNMLLKLLSEFGENSPLNSAVSVSAPMDLNISARTIDKGSSRIYQKHLLKYLKKSLLKKYEEHPMKEIIGINHNYVKKIESIWNFDHLYTAKMHNFGTAKEYYKQSSAKQYLKNIKTPTLIIHALDDPFMTKDILPNKDEISSSIELEISKNGGHVGFISGSVFNPKYWLEDRIVEYFKN